MNRYKPNKNSMKMQNALYMHNSYLKEFEATVVSVKDGKYIILDKTAFYPQGGGQPFDTGIISCNGVGYEVVSVKKADGNIVHEADKEGLKQNDNVTGKINWDRRYKFMRMHTACHLISSIFHNKAGALITGNQIDLDKTRIDFSLDSFDRDKINEYAELANKIIEKDLPVSVSFMKREEALKIKGMVKLAGALPPNIEEIRIVEIEGVDTQADGGTHVKSLKEIGRIEIVGMENKGKANRRVYFTIK